MCKTYVSVIDGDYRLWYDALLSNSSFVGRIITDLAYRGVMSDYGRQDAGRGCDRVLVPI